MQPLIYERKLSMQSLIYERVASYIHMRAAACGGHPKGRRRPTPRSSSQYVERTETLLQCYRCT